MDATYADISIRMSEFKKNPAYVLRSAGEKPVTILDRDAHRSLCACTCWGGQILAEAFRVSCLPRARG